MIKPSWRSRLKSTRNFLQVHPQRKSREEYKNSTADTTPDGDEAVAATDEDAVAEDSAADAAAEVTVEEEEADVEDEETITDLRAPSGSPSQTGDRSNTTQHSTSQTRSITYSHVKTVICSVESEKNIA